MLKKQIMHEYLWNLAPLGEGLVVGMVCDGGPGGGTGGGGDKWQHNWSRFDYMTAVPGKKKTKKGNNKGGGKEGGGRNNKGPRRWERG